MKWRPSRNQLGQVVAPAVICLSAEPQADDASATVVPVGSQFTALAEAGDEVHFQDARGQDRCLNVVEATDMACVCVTEQTAYVTSGLEIELRRGDNDDRPGQDREAPSETAGHLACPRAIC